MSRLTNDMREDVLDKLKAETIGPRYDALRKELAAACQEAADRWHPPAVRKWLEAMPKAAKELIAIVGTVEPYVGKQNRLEDPFDEAYHLKISLPRPVFARDGRGWDTYVHLDNGANFQTRLEALHADWEQLRITASAALWGCNTVKQLQERFPDLAAKLPKPEPKTKALTITPEKVAEAVRCAKEGGCK